jgi:DNA-binding NtrC family response regulator
MSGDPIRVLVVDDEAYTRELFSSLLEGDEYEVVPASGGAEALEMFRSSRFDIVLLDLKMPGMNGMEVLERMRKIDADVSVLMMTGHGTIDSAVEAMKLGAEDYFTKPFENIEELKLTIGKVIRYRRLREENRFLKSQLRPGSIIGSSRKMMDVFRLIEKVAPLGSTILITGESGTGKELVARTIHSMSPRRSRRFVAVNCGGLPETLLESTLFGHEKGAFTGAVRTTRGYFEEASGGTLFLDEIGETSPSLQVRLLRVLQERSFERVGGTTPVKTDIRIIAATNMDLSRRVEERTFREDLFYRINVIQIVLPPLRERPEDIPLLANHFLKKYAGEFGKEIGSFSRDALEAMIAYRWPGNVRELENVVERAVALEEDRAIRRISLPAQVAERGGAAPVSPNGLSYREAKERFERDYIVEALRRAGGNISKAARESGLARQNFHKKIVRYGVDIRELRDR